MSIKLYYDLMSQPSRSLYILLKKINCEFVPKYVNLREGQHYSDEFAQVNRMKTVPVIDHNGFVLTESVAILKYLSRENIIPDSLYPKDSKMRARVDEFLEWQHVGLRLHCAMYFRVKYLDPIFTGRKPDEHQISNYERRMKSALEDFNTKWLGRGNDFIVGNTITVADLMAASELEQPRMAGFDPKTYSNIGPWALRVQQYFNPYYDEAHVVLNKIVSKQQKISAHL